VLDKSLDGNSLFGTFWLPIKDADPRAIALYLRHYSARHYRDRRRRTKFVGPGEYLALLTLRCDALFIWRRFRSDDHQEGVNCALFRNESGVRSSTLIREAMEWAWLRWPGERLYTYVNPLKVRSKEPGKCFRKAGWRDWGTNKDGSLLILDMRPSYSSYEVDALG
jgi:hypothetical protein